MKKFAKVLIVASFAVIAGCETQEDRNASLRSDIEETAKLRNERLEYEQNNARYQKAYETKVQIEQIKQKLR